MPVVLTPTPPVRFTIARLRQSIAETSRFTDEELRTYINDGYRMACERSRILQAIGTVTIAAGANTGPLPADWFRTLAAFAGGVELEPAPLTTSTLQLRNTYFQHGTTFGLGLAPEEGATVTILYVQVPVDLGFDDTPRWGREHDPILRSYAAWRCVKASGGAQTVRKARMLRDEFDAGVRDLRRTTVAAPAGAHRKRSVLDLRGAPIAG